MNTTTRWATLVALTTGPLLAACDDGSTGPVEPLTTAAVTLDAELAVAIDDGLAETALASAEATLGRTGSLSVEARLREARDQFSHARRRWAASDPDGAREHGRRARRAIADALVEGRGAAIVGSMIEETRALMTTLSVSDVGYADAPELGATLASLVAAARQALNVGSHREAAERMVAARQHTDRAARDWHRDSDRRRDRPHDDLRPEAWARLQVAQGAQAIRLAWGVIGGSPTEAQARLMEAAAELQRRAEAALAAGRLGAAAALAHGAEIKALVAVVASDGLGHAGVESVASLATHLLAEAREAVASGGSAVDLAIFKVAVHLYEEGEARLRAGNPRGVVLLWHSATMAAVLIGG